MPSRQTKHRQKRFAEGSREITLMLSAKGIAALDARKEAEGKSRVQVIEEWLLSDRN
jgi:hypothetical protein